MSYFCHRPLFPLFSIFSNPVIGSVPLASKSVGLVAFGHTASNITFVLSSTNIGSFAEPISNK
ncbi:MAG: hypothetical protein H0W19_07955 [Nitrosopumilus sp.]|nr:hypothetical protein [Nitrosopumilus sp.]